MSDENRQGGVNGKTAEMLISTPGMLVDKIEQESGQQVLIGFGITNSEGKIYIGMNYSKNIQQDIAFQIYVRLGGCLVNVFGGAEGIKNFEDMDNTQF